MAERHWNKNEISKEEMNMVNTIMRIAYYNKGAFVNKQISKARYDFNRYKCIHALGLCEKYFDEIEVAKRDYDNWKQSYELYESVRKEITNV